MTEDQFQAACIEWIWNTYPETRRCFWAVPNGGGRSKVDAAKFKATGVLAGVHDLHFLWDDQFYTFELKVGDNQMTTDTIVTTARGAQKKVFGQVEWGEAIAKQGGVWFEVRPTMYAYDPLSDFKKLFIEVLEGKYKKCRRGWDGNGWPIM